MRTTTKIALVALISFTLSACVTSLVVGNAQSKLMWALLKPLVGFDPNEVNLFEQPMIKNRMVKLLGSRYDGTMRLLKTANEIRQEGALFYVISRYTPLPGIAKETAEKAGFVWNADTNQMAVMLITGDASTVLAEQMDNVKEAITPTWPTEIQGMIDSAEQAKENLQDAATRKTTEMINESLGLEGEQPLLEQIIHEAIDGKQKSDGKPESGGKSVGDRVKETLNDAKDRKIEETIAPLREKIDQPVNDGKEILNQIEDPEKATEETMDAISEKMEKPKGDEPFDELQKLLDAEDQQRKIDAE